MDINSQFTPDQSGSASHFAVESLKSKNGLMLILIVLLVVSLLGNIYFLTQTGGTNLPEQPQGEQMPVQQTETQPATNTDRDQVTEGKQVINNLSQLNIAIPADWKIQVKPFDNLDDTIGFKSQYFSSCSNNCQGVRLTKNETQLDLIFNKVMDSHGGLCSNNATTTKLSNNWYRIKDSKNYTYAKRGISFDKTLNEVFQVVPKTTASDWSYEEGKKYNVCLTYTGEYLDIVPDDEDPKFNEYALMLEYPTVSIDTPEATLQEIDQIISSI